MSTRGMTLLSSLLVWIGAYLMGGWTAVGLLALMTLWLIVLVLWADERTRRPKEPPT